MPTYPNYGLLTNIAGGIKEAMSAYQTTKQMQLEADRAKQHDRQEEMANASKIAEQLGYIPRGYFSPEVEAAFSGGQKPQTPASGLLTPPAAPQSSMPSVSPQTPAVQPPAAPAQPSSMPSMPSSASPAPAPGLMANQPPPGAIVPPGLMTKRDRERQHQENQINAALAGKALTGHIDPQTGKLTIEEGPLMGRAADDERRKREKEEELSKETATAAGYARRLEESNNILNNLAEGGYNRADTGQSLIESLTPGAALSSERRQQDQAERNFVNAVLRPESGAAISESEFENAKKQYFPRAGDSQQVLDNKKQVREQVIATMKGAAGPRALKKIPLVQGSASGGSANKKPAGSSGKIKVSNGKETLMIDPGDLKHATADGYKQVE